MTPRERLRRLGSAAFNVAGVIALAFIAFLFWVQAGAPGF
jgi:hypothetical protein